MKHGKGKSVNPRDKDPNKELQEIITSNIGLESVENGCDFAEGDHGDTSHCSSQ